MVFLLEYNTALITRVPTNYRVFQGRVNVLYAQACAYEEEATDDDGNANDDGSWHDDGDHQLHDDNSY